MGLYMVILALLVFKFGCNFENYRAKNKIQSKMADLWRPLTILRAPAICDRPKVPDV